MNWNEIITIVVGSSITTTIINIVWNLFILKSKEKEIREESLYSPLKFYLTYTQAIKDHINKVSDAEKSGFVKLEEVLDPQRRNELTSEQIKSSFDLSDVLVAKWWQCIEEIHKLLEKHSDKLDKKHRYLIKDFIDGYIARDYLGKIKQNKIAPTLYSKLRDEEIKLVDVIGRMQKKILV